ncbi:hypothetical protein H4R18_002160 [Coemansia javaensis]|uniref:Ribosomal RNA-processing protein 41 n=1 Tax=Coemansia javaensis TaxID=2761396 RepID=A0A9W8HHK3_9FUNG|nr:hypothetical protein H4R18_002160 [Coemansia javaensis]
MSRQELLSPEGLRVDGRRANELRRILCRASVLNTADGSAYYEQGNTKVLVAVYGPREARIRGVGVPTDRAVVNVEFNVAPFSTSERRQRSKGDKRLLEVASFVRQTFEGAIQRAVYPRSQIDIYLHLLQHDGGTLEACINAATLALVDAGVAMDDYVCACTAGFVDETPVLDLNGVEESALETPALTVAVLPRSGNVALLQMESRLHSAKFDPVVELAVEGCKHIHHKLDDAVLAAAGRREFVAKALCPRILVVATAPIADACAVNGCGTFAELLAPFGQDVSTQITVQDGQGAPYFLDKLDVRFTADFALKRHVQPSPDEIDALVRRSAGEDSAAAAAAAQARMPLTATASGADRVADGDPGEWAPWYLRFRQHWANEMPPSEHEGFMHPVACLLVASGSEDDPVGALRALQSHPAVQRVQQQSFSSGSALLCHMLVHDGRDAGGLQTIDQKFDQVRRGLGQNSMLLSINSNSSGAGPDEAADRAKISSAWANTWPTMHPLAPPPDATFGGMLTMRDVAALRDAVKQLMVRSVVPHMQYLIRTLSDQTASQRRGITGRLFSAGRRYFGAGAKAGSTATGADGEAYFRYDSPEGMMRKLADYSFMLKDYRFAQSVYQVARRDFQSEKAWKCYAGAQEMVGVCKLMWEAQAAKAEAEANFDDAVAVYLHKTYAPCHYFAVRSVVLCYELLRHSRLFALAPRALLQLPPSPPGLHALLAEQAAYAHLQRPARPELRRFALYAMVAARSYQAAGLGELARRCLRMVRLALGPDGAEPGPESAATAAASLPSRSGWSSIDSYVNHELGQQCVAAREYGDALHYFMALLGSGQIPAKLQSTYLQELLQLYLERSDSSGGGGDSSAEQLDPAVELAIPEIDARLARVIMSPDLEGEDGVLRWRLGGAPSREAAEAASPCCSVGEDVAVLLMVTNPLTVGITLNGFTLECEMAAADGETAAAAAPEVSAVESVVLEGGQTAMVSVTVTPRCAGSLEIRGARYTLCDILPVRKPLVVPGRRLNDTKEQRAAPAYSPDTCLGFRVDPEFPRLEVALDGIPDTLASGSMHRAAIRIVNRGPLPCRSIALWVSHPPFFDVRSPTVSGGDGAAADDMYVRADTVPETEEASVANSLRDCSTLVLVGPAAEGGGSDGPWPLVPLEGLEPGAAMVVPMWVRGDRVGAHTLSLALGASTADASRRLLAGGALGCEMRSRRFDIDLVVTPSLRVNAFVRPSLRDPHERILGIEIENMRPGPDIQLLQTTFVSGHYELVPLRATDGRPPPAPGHGMNVGPRQTVSLVYRARPRQLPAGGPTPEQFTVRALQQYIYSKEKPSAAPGPITLVYSTAVLGGGGGGGGGGAQGVDVVRSPLQAFSARAQAHRRRAALRSRFPLIPERHHPALFPLYETFGIDFMLLWREIDDDGGGGSGCSGHHSITGIDLGVPHDYIVEALDPPAEGAARAWLANTVQEREALVQSIAAAAAATTAAADGRHERPLDVAMRVTQTASGGEGALHEAEVAVTVYNHSWRYAYDATLDLISPAELGRLVPAGVRLDYSGPRSAWSWCGATRHTVSVPPLGSAVVHARLACCAPGMLDVGLWALAARAQPLPGEAQPAAHHHRPRSIEAQIYPLQPCLVCIA